MEYFIPLLSENDEEVAIFEMILNSKDRHYNYLQKMSGVFSLNEFSDSFCVTHFRFRKADIKKLRILFRIPEEIILRTRVKVPGDEALCILLHRLAYPNRYADLMKLFPRGRSALSAIFNTMVRYILTTSGHVLEDLNQPLLSRENIRLYCHSLYEKGSPYSRCFGFLDGTIRPICRPVYHQRKFYNGHKRVHAIKFQDLMLPNGIIANLFGPVIGRRHDAYVLAKSQLLTRLEHKFQRFRNPPYMYSDSGYPLRKFLITPFKGAVDPRQKFVNKEMSKLRVSVEWGHGKVIQLFAFLDFKKNLKIWGQEVADYYKVGVILTNCHTCLYGSQVSDYFRLDPPELENYLRN